MKKTLLITALTILLIAAPVVYAEKPTTFGNSKAQNNLEHGNSTENHGNQNNNQESNNQPKITPTSTITNVVSSNDVQLSPTVTPSVTPSVTPADTEEQDQSLIDEKCDPAAHWKNHGEYVKCVAHLHQGGEEVSEAAHSDVGKKHIDESPTPSASPSPSISPITSANPTIGSGISPLAAGIGDFFGKIFGFLKHLL